MTVPAGQTLQLFSMQLSGLFAPYSTCTVEVRPTSGSPVRLLDAAAVPGGSAVPVMVGDHALVGGDQIRATASGVGRVTFLATGDLVSAASSSLARHTTVLASNAQATVATVPAGKRWRVLGLQASGLSAPESQITVHLRTSGDDYEMLRAAVIPDARAVPLMAGSWVMEPGDQITAQLAAAEQRVNVYLTIDETDA